MKATCPLKTVPTPVSPRVLLIFSPTPSSERSAKDASTLARDSSSQPRHTSQGTSHFRVNPPPTMQHRWRSEGRNARCAKFYANEDWSVEGSNDSAWTIRVEGRGLPPPTSLAWTHLIVHSQTQWRSLSLPGLQASQNQLECDGSVDNRLDGLSCRLESVSSQAFCGAVLV